jgi:ATP-dependent exoDNAse (exonuclease V) beta subunit
MGTKRLLVYRASAGSGKTHQLVTTYLRLVLASADPLAVRQTLAITFTQKAAQEMRHRILKQLRQMGSLDDAVAYQASDSIRSELLETLKLEPEVLRDRSRRLHRTMLHRYSDAAIGTIDSFISQMARPFYRELRSGQDFEIELDRDALIEEAIEPFLAQVGQKENDVSTLLLKFSQHLNKDEKSWNIRHLLVRYASFLFQDRAYPYLETLQKIKPADYAAFYDQLAEILEEKYGEQREGASSLLEELALAGYSAEQLYYGSKGLIYHLEKHQQNIAHKLHSSVEKALTDQNRILKSGTHPPDFQNWVDRLRIFLSQQKAVAPDMVLMQAVLDLRYATTLLGTLYQHFTDFSRANVKMPLNFLYFQLADLVQQTHPEYLCDRVGHRYLNMLVDEFQDTSLLQWQCLEPLMDNGLASGGTAMVVGDVKQSIYRWRNGDARLLAALPATRWDSTASRLWAEMYEGIPLQTNYRSRNNILHFNNSFFGWCRQNWEGLMASTYLEVEQELPQAPVTCPPWQGRTRILAFDPSTTERSLETNRVEVCYKLIQHYRQQGIKASDIAILVRTNRTGSALAQGLIRRGQAVVSPDNLLLGLNPRVRLMMHAWFYLHQPGDPVHAETLLRDLDPDAYLQDPTRNAGTALLEKFPSLVIPSLLALPLAAQMQELAVVMNLAHQPSPFVQRLLDEWVNQCAKGPRIQDLEDWWLNVGHQIKIQWSGTDEAVQLMTVHSAKGLQFEVVLVAEMDRRNKKAVLAQQWISQIPAESWGMDEKVPPGVVPVHLVDTSALKNAPKDFAALAETEGHLNDLDYINILYVALTRAKTHMEIFTEKWNGKKDGLFSLGNIWGAYIQGQDLVSDPWTRTERDSEWPGEPETWSLQPASTPDLPLALEITQPKPTPPLESELAPRHFSSARLALNQNLHWPDLPTEAIEAGVYLHRLMAKIHDRQKSESVLQTWNNDESIAPGLRQKVSQWARSLLHRPDLEAFFNGRSTVLREHPVLLQDGSSLQPDLILLGEDGSARVMDFKTGRPRKEHRDQLEQYLNILQKAGYPSSGALVYTEDESVDAID